MRGGPLEEAARQLHFIAVHLREADPELRKELQAAITTAARPVPEAIRAGLAPRLPDPYAADLSTDVRITVSKRYGARDPGVTVRATPRSGKRRKLRRLDRGVLAHPLFGRRRYWFDQSVGPGWFTEPAAQAGARARTEIIAAMHRIAALATRKG